MSGGIIYRLSPKERALLQDSTGLFQSVLQRLEKKGVRLQLADPELNVTAEETPQGTRFFLVYPLDNDLRSNSGRIYLQDEFILDRQDQQLVSFSRTFKQDVERDSKIPFWLDVAKSDHPQTDFSSRRAHLELFLKDLKTLPLPDASDPALQEFQDKVLKNLHRPFPDNYKEVVGQNIEVFQEMIDILGPLGVQMKFADTQSGVSVRRDGKKIQLKLTIVVDDNRGTDPLSREYARIFLIDEFTVDADTHEILDYRREISPTNDLGVMLTRANELMQAARVPAIDSVSLKNLVQGFLKGLSFEKKPSLAPAPATEDYAKLRAEAQTREERILIDLFALTDPTQDIARAMTPGLPSAVVSAVPRGALGREAFHQALGFLVRKRETAADDIMRLAARPELSDEYRSLIRSLAFLADNRLKEASRELAALPVSSALKTNLAQVIAHRSRRETAAWGLPILRAAAFERLDKIKRDDAAWLLPASGNDSNRGAEARKQSLEKYLTRLENHLKKNGGTLQSALDALPPADAYENFFEREVFASPTVGQLISLLGEPDSVYRQESLAALVRRHLTGQDPWPATVAAIGLMLGEDAPERADIDAWLSGSPGFARKIEAWLPHVAGEVTSPHMLAGIAVAGTVASFSKFVFLGRFGYSTQTLRWGAEGAALALEAPVFLTTQRLLASSFVTSEHQWDRFGSELLGSYLAFGTLRLAGRGSTRLNQYLQKNYFESSLTADAFLDRPVKALMFRIGAFRPWVPEWFKGGVSHAAGFTSLTLANRISRGLGLRPESKQGWKSDFLDDVLMYGQYSLAGHLAERIRPHLGIAGYENYLAAMEASPLQGSMPPSGRLQNILEGLRGWRNWKWIQKGSNLLPGRFRIQAPTVPGRPPTIPPLPALPSPEPSEVLLPGAEAAAEAVVPGSPPRPPSELPPPPVLEPHAYLRFKKIPLSPNGENRKEWILGRDEPSATMGGPVKKIIFAVHDSVLAANHARITLKILTPPPEASEGELKAVIPDYEYAIEALDGYVFVNDLGIEKGDALTLKNKDVIQLGENGKKLIFESSQGSPTGFLQEAPIPLDPMKDEWTIGRLTTKGPAADIPIPSTERQISRQHARILRNEKGDYFIQSYSGEGTFVHDERVYGTKALLHQDKVQLGGKQDKNEMQIFWFEIPGIKTRGRAPKVPPYLPSSAPLPAQTEVHPIYRGLTWQEVETRVEQIRSQLDSSRQVEAAMANMGLSEDQLAQAGLASHPPMPPSISLAKLDFSNNLKLELQADRTGFIIGSNPALPEDPPYTAAVPIPNVSGLEPRHVRIFLDDYGRFILEDLNTPSGVFVHERVFRDVETIVNDSQTGSMKTEIQRVWREIPKDLHALNRVSGWTYLYGGERIFLGKKLYFDFWPGTVFDVTRGPADATGNLPPSAAEDPSDQK